MVSNNTTTILSYMSRSIIVKKSYDLVLSSFQLPVTEYRFINLCTGGVFYKNIISENNEVYVSLDEYSELFSMTKKEAKSQFKSIRENLTSRVVFMHEINQIFPWIHSIDMKTSDEMFVKFHKESIENLFGLEENFISYDLNNILLLDSQHAIRLYEVAKTISYSNNKKKIDISLDKFKLIMGIPDKYQSYGEFKKLLNKCVGSINDLTDINIRFTERKLEKKVKNLVFFAEEKEPNKNIYQNIDVTKSPEFLETIDWRSRTN